MLEIRHRAMACDFVVMMRDEGPFADAVLDRLEHIDALESMLSIYKTNSEISRINRATTGTPVKVSSDAFWVIERAIELSARTGGAFDVSAGPLIDAWGFTERKGRKPSREEIESARQRVGFQHIEVSRPDRTVALSLPGMSLNLGAIGKGFAIDWLANELHAIGVMNFLIHAGASSVMAHGNQFEAASNNDDDDAPKGWLVGLLHPT
ncbi:MAG: FAD:protein FMN transferase, partial [Planctomycetota bacterium]